MNIIFQIKQLTGIGKKEKIKLNQSESIDPVLENLNINKNASTNTVKKPTIMNSEYTDIPQQKSAVDPPCKNPYSNLENIEEQKNIPNSDFDKVNMKKILGKSSDEDDMDFLGDCDDVISPPEPSNAKRIFFRFLMGLLPAIAAVFLEQSIISVISTASGFLAPPFVIIFPALLTMKLRNEGKIDISNCVYYSLFPF